MERTYPVEKHCRLLKETAYRKKWIMTKNLMRWHIELNWIYDDSTYIAIKKVSRLNGARDMEWCSFVCTRCIIMKLRYRGLISSSARHAGSNSIGKRVQARYIEVRYCLSDHPIIRPEMLRSLGCEGSRVFIRFQRKAYACAARVCLRIYIRLRLDRCRLRIFVIVRNSSFLIRLIVDRVNWFVRVRVNGQCRYMCIIIIYY